MFKVFSLLRGFLFYDFICEGDGETCELGDGYNFSFGDCFGGGYGCGDGDYVDCGDGENNDYEENLEGDGMGDSYRYYGYGIDESNFGCLCLESGNE